MHHLVRALLFPAFALALARHSPAQLELDSFPRPVFGIGALPSGLTLADLDANGRPDLVATSHHPDVVAALLVGNDGLPLGPALVTPLAAEPRSVVAANLDANAYADLVLAHESQNRLSLLFGAGDGTFAAPLDVTVAGGPRHLAAGDLDGDGDSDLAVTRAVTGGVVLYENVGGGVLSVSQTIAGGLAVSVAIEDFDADGRLDLGLGGLSGSYRVYPGEGDGTVDAAAFVDLGTLAAGSMVDVALLDANEDGLRDVALLYNETGFSLVGVRLAGPGGSYGPIVAYPAGQGGVGLEAGDFDADGQPDLAVGVASSSGVGSVRVLTGFGDGNFATQLDLQADTSLDGLATGDLDGDGLDDLALASPAGLSLWHQRSEGLFGVVPVTILRRMTDLALADLDDDGVLDLVVACYGDFAHPAGLFTARGRGDGRMLPVSFWPSGGNPLDLAVADVTDDGVPDLVSAGFLPTSLRLFAGLGDGTFAPAVNLLPGSTCVRVLAHDVDGDQRVDLVVRRSSPTEVTVLLGTGGGSFAAPVSTAVAEDASLAVGDVTGDGVPDLVRALTSSKQLALHPGQGDGTFGAPQNLPSPHATLGPRSVLIGDVDGDTIVDLVGMHTGAALLHRGLGGGTFEAQVLVDDAEAGLLVDVDEDGKPDLVGGRGRIARGHGDGSFTEVGTWLGGVGGVTLAVGDVDLDGRNDLAASSDSLGAEQALLLLQRGGLWNHLGSGLAGQYGKPALEGFGLLQPGELCGLSLHGGHPSTSAWFLIGTSVLGVPFMGGTLVPTVDFVLLLATDAAGTVFGATPWPPGLPPGTSIVVQAWILDAGAPFGFAATNGVLATSR